MAGVRKWLMLEKIHRKVSGTQFATLVSVALFS